MQYKSTCPSCDAKQSLWDFFEPFLGYVNICKYCGNAYRTDNLSNIFAFSIGVIIGALLILAQEEYISWLLAITIDSLMLTVLILIAPYVTKLKKVETEDIAKKRNRSFLINQLAISFFVILMLTAKIYAHKYNAKIYNIYCCVAERIEKLNSTEDLRKVAMLEHEHLIADTKIYKQLTEINIMCAVFISIFLFLNLSFYFKIKQTNIETINQNSS